ncbi:MATE family efflux transporter [Paenibacillus sp. 2RAB27]|uniref:MATE family efflux transporter n=1 Tax=Paenibacillus sp. 2RAB27 TaxID=3232991 RepID=UPI003F9B1E63
MFALLTSLTGWYLLVDIGLGYSLQNHISERRAKEQSYLDLIFVTAIIALIIMVLAIVLLFYSSQYIAPILLKNFEVMKDYEKSQYFFVVGILFIIATIGGIAYKIWYAQHKGYFSNIIPALSYIIAFLGIYWVLNSGNNDFSDKLLWCFIFYIGPPALLSIISFILQIIKYLKTYFKQGLTINFLATVKSLMNKAFHFWVISIMAAGVLQIDYIVMSQKINADEIVIYNVTTKIFLLIAFIYNAVLMALWPVCAELIAKSKWAGVITHIKKNIIIGLFFTMVSTLIIIVFNSFIINILSPSEHLIVPVKFIVLMGCYQLIRVWADTFAMILQSMSDMRPFWIWVPVQAVVCFVLQWALSPIFGINGILIGLIGSYVLTVVWSFPRAVFHHIKK